MLRDSVAIIAILLMLSGIVLFTYVLYVSINKAHAKYAATHSTEWIVCSASTPDVVWDVCDTKGEACVSAMGYEHMGMPALVYKHHTCVVDHTTYMQQ